MPISTLHGLSLPDKNTIIWRYMDFSKFMSLLDKRCLFFSRADLLGDPFEGSVTEQDVKYREKFWERIIDASRERGINVDEFRSKIPVIDSDVNEAFRKWTYVSCWHINNFDSIAMWKLYTSSKDAVAIRSTLGRLLECLEFSTDVFHIGQVNYIDYTKDASNHIGPFSYFNKSKAYVSEAELRVITQVIPDHKIGTSYFSGEIAIGGVYIKVDLNRLIDKLFVPPGSQDWFKLMMKSIIEKYELAKEVSRTSLDDSPIF